MIRGIESFKEWFKDFKDNYVIIGGSACDILMNEEGYSFRVTKDIDLVIIVEAFDKEFGKRFWDYLKLAKYENKNKSNGKAQFYRFSHPISNDYPYMIELFTRKPNSIILPNEDNLTPLPIEDQLSSLSAILLDDDYYNFLKEGRINKSELIVLDVMHLIPFKAKAYLDLNSHKENGESIDSSKIKKHLNDILRLSLIIPNNQKPLSNVPTSIKKDMSEFLNIIKNKNINLKQLGILNRTKDSIIDSLSKYYL